MNPTPVIGDIESSRYPRVVVRHHVVEKSSDGGGTTGSTSQSAMQSHGHHSSALGMQHIEAVFQIIEKLLAAIKALRRRKSHVIRVKRVRNHELRRRKTGVPVRHIVGVRV